jgi:tetratricopeptide (TPR) repeat protein
MPRALSVLLLSLSFSLSALAQPSKSVADYYQEGKKLIDSNKITEAYASFRNAISLDPNHTNALLQAGWCANDLEKYDEAYNYLTRAKKLDDLNDWIYYELGYALKHLNKISEAIVSYKKALELSPDYYLASLDLANIYYDTDDYANALQYYAVYLQDENADNFYYYRAAWCANDLSQFKDALAYIDKYEPEESADKSKKLVEKGFANYMLANYVDALSDLKAAVKLNNKAKLAYYYQGLCYLDTNDKSKAMDVYNKLKTVDVEEAGKLLAKINSK